ncbi:MAG: Fic family protein, partial [Eubacterium sp.]
MIHPFREGNGRTQRVFLTQLINYNGYTIDFSEIDTDELMIATIQSANGVTDYLNGENSLTPPTISTDNVEFPVIGDVAAGFDKVAIEDWTGDKILIPSSYLKGRS